MSDVRARAGPSARGVDALLRRLLQERWRTFTLQLGRAQRRPGTEAIHDVRVATRRLLASLALVDAVCVTKAGRKVRKPARTLLKTLNAVRDVQVQRETVRRMARHHPVLRSYGVHLRQQEALLLHQAAAAFRAVPLVAIEQALGVLEGELDRALDRPPVRQAGMDLLRGTVAASYARAMARRRAIRFDRPDSLHRFRVAFKKFRYSIEVLENVFPWVDRRVRKAMNRYQTTLGELQDLEVFSAGLRAFARSRRRVRMGPLSSYLPVYSSLERRRERLLDRFRRSMDDADRFWGESGRER